MSARLVEQPITEKRFCAPVLPLDHAALLRLILVRPARNELVAVQQSTNKSTNKISIKTLNTQTFL
jgi:hypothetical protein